MKHLRNAALISAATMAFANPKSTAAADKVTAPAPEAPKPTNPRNTAPVTISGIAALPQPERKSKRGSTSQFPFASLTAIGMAFGVKDRDAKSLSQIISNQNRRHLVDKTDQNGNTVYKTTETIGADGTKTVVPTQEAEKTHSRKFYAFDVTKEYAEAHLKGTDLEGSSVLVFREV